MISEIQDVDCIAREVKYHKSCYRQYTKVVNIDKTSDEISATYDKAYTVFCTVVKERIIKNYEILSMIKLLKIFIENVSAIDPTENCSTSIRQLKRWIQRDFPQLVFIKPKQRNLHEFVLFRDSSDDVVVIDQAATNTDEGSMDEIDPVPAHFPVEFDSKSILYKASLILKNLMAESPSLRGTWPPTAEELDKNAVKEMVPVLLFNFLAWCMGSEDLTVNDFVKVDKNLESKLLSICQDIMFVHSKGRKQTPKHLSLSMAIRHISGSSKIIGLLNGLGHCISHSATLEQPLQKCN